MLGVEAEGADVDDGFVNWHLLKFITTFQIKTFFLDLLNLLLLGFPPLET
jgi:hypothetical protein